MMWVRQHVPSRNLVYSGGLALNCIANSMIAKLGIFDRIWIMPDPGDAGSSLGAALAYKKDFVDWMGPYLGHDISRRFDADGAASALAAGEIIGIATGRAEFGPRALGNRSLLADPRGRATKDRVNDIKRREPFRPFAPVVLQHRADEYFEMIPSRIPYMQFGVRCRRPDLLPAVCHVDGTSRTQTVDAAQNATLAELLERFEAKTGCPVLLNTSLNVRGQPIVNTWEDAKEFSHSSNVRVF
jgi:carbamoyltransferase